MAPLEIEPDRLFAKLGRQDVELELLRERVAELEAELNATRTPPPAEEATP